MLSSPRWPLLLTAIALPLVTLARPAAACSPPLSGLQSTNPAEGSSLPANSSILFLGYNISLAGVQVTVDGMPELAPTLVAASDKFPALFGSGTSISTFSKVYLVDPPPPAGQAITIAGAFCQGSPDMCQKTLHYTLLEPDTTPPAAPTEVHYDRYDYQDFKSSGGDCQSNSDVGYWVHLEGQAAAPGEALVIHRIEAFADASLTVPIFGSLALAQPGETIVGYRVLASQLGGNTAADLCFRVTTFDAAGNVSPQVALSCKPCHARVEPPPGTKDFSSLAEPEWTDADLVPGGSCSPDQGSGGQAGAGQAGSGNAGSGNAGSGNEGGSSAAQGGGGPAVAPVAPESSSGCGCRAAGQVPSGPAAGLVALLGALVARRRKGR